jgi:uncharacterized protein YjbI with pentapeptide repeats
METPIDQEEEVLTEAEDDEIVSFPMPGKRHFYVLKERNEHREERIKIPDLYKYFPLEEIRVNYLENMDKELLFIDAEGEYYPDFIEEKNLYFFSIKLLEDYVKYKVLVKREDVYNRVVFCSEGRYRQEEYVLVIPEQIDCIAEGTARYDKNYQLEYFEIDPEKTKNHDIFRVKGFPHLIITGKLNRQEFTGYECERIENYFNYELERDKMYALRAGGEQLKIVTNQFFNCVYHNNVCCIDKQIEYILKESIEEMRASFSKGLRDILDSLKCDKMLADKYTGYNITLIFNRTGYFELIKENAKYFEKNNFVVEGYQKLYQFSDSFPKIIQAEAVAVIKEQFFHIAASASNMIEHFKNIHNNFRFRLYLSESDSRLPILLYDYKNTYQYKIESAESIRQCDLDRKNLREFNLSGKNLNSIKFVDVDLSHAIFNGANLNEVEFTGCDLTGSCFEKTILNKVRFVNCNLKYVKFISSLLNINELMNNDLSYISCINSNFLRTTIINEDMENTYFYKSNIKNCMFRIVDNLFHTVFILCSMHDVFFDKNITDNCMEYCDFRNTNISNSIIRINKMSSVSFIKTNLNSVSLLGSAKIEKSDFSWSKCINVNWDGIVIEDCKFNGINRNDLFAKNR